jgi:cell division protease FtsH
VLNANRKVLDRLATELLEKETLDHNQLAEIFKDVKKLPLRKQWLSSNERPVSKLPPVKVPAKKADAQTAEKKAVAKKPATKPAAKKAPAKAAAKPAAKKPAAKA